MTLARDSKGRFIKQNKDNRAEAENVLDDFIFSSVSYSYEKHGDKEPIVSGKKITIDSNNKKEEKDLSKEEIQELFNAEEKEVYVPSINNLSLDFNPWDIKSAFYRLLNK